MVLSRESFILSSLAANSLRRLIVFKSLVVDESLWLLLLLLLLAVDDNELEFFILANRTKAS